MICLVVTWCLVVQIFIILLTHTQKTEETYYIEIMHGHSGINPGEPFFVLDKGLLFGRACREHRETLTQKLCDIEWVVISVVMTAIMLLFIVCFNNCIEHAISLAHDQVRNVSIYSISNLKLNLNQLGQFISKLVQSLLPFTYTKT